MIYSLISKSELVCVYLIDVKIINIYLCIMLLLILYQKSINTF